MAQHCTSLPACKACKGSSPAQHSTVGDPRSARMQNATDAVSHCTVGPLTAQCCPDVAEPGRAMLLDCVRLRSALKISRAMRLRVGEYIKKLPGRWPDARRIDVSVQSITARRSHITVSTGGLIASLLDLLMKVQTPTRTRPEAYSVLAGLASTARSSSAGEAGVIEVTHSFLATQACFTERREIARIASAACRAQCTQDRIATPCRICGAL